MNVFTIPSWYPSFTNRIPGIFFREQAGLYALHFPDDRIGISHWGQNDQRLLLRIKDPILNFRNLLRKSEICSTVNRLSPNCIEYFQPTFTWSWKCRKGNIRAIFQANLENARKFRDEYGETHLLHAQVGFPSGYIAMLMSEELGIPYIITEQMSPFPFKYFRNRNGSLADRIMLPYENAQTNVAVSHALADKMRATGVPKVKVIHNFVDEQLFTFSRNEYHLRFDFFTLGRMEEQKGIDILLRAIRKVGTKIDMHFYLAGDGKLLKRYQKLGIDLGIGKHITWLGDISRKEARDYFQKCHAFVLPSRHESMGIVFAEAIACGKPVIGTRCGGPEEIINATNGILVPPEDSESLAKAIIRMVDSYDAYDQQAIRNDFEKRFSSKVITKQIHDLYREII